MTDPDQDPDRAHAGDPTGDAAESRRRGPRSPRGRNLALAAAGLALPLIGLAMLIRSCAHTAVSGEVAVGGDHGWREPLNRCRTGEFQSFLGVELGRDRDGKMLVRARLDPDRGPVLELVPPTGGVTVELTAATCPSLALEVRKVGVDGEGAALLDGRVVARCALPDGRPLQLDGWWRRCGPT